MNTIVRDFEHVVRRIIVNINRGGLRDRPKQMLADAAYDTEAIRCYLRIRGIKSSIPYNNRNLKHTRK